MNDLPMAAITRAVEVDRQPLVGPTSSPPTLETRDGVRNLNGCSR